MTAAEHLNNIELRLLSPMVTYTENATEDAPKMLAALRVVLDAIEPLDPVDVVTDVDRAVERHDEHLRQAIEMALNGATKVAHRYDQCDETCTVDCGHCKGAGRPVELGGAL